jgi:phosphate transport system substrate-binding protein
VATRYRALLAAAAVMQLMLAAGCAAGGPGRSPVTLAGSPGAARPAISAAPAPQPESLSETGSTLLFPLFGVWAAAYHQQYSQVTVKTGATGSGAGIAGASAGTVNIGASDAYLSSGDMVKNPQLLNIPLAVSAQQVNYNVPGLKAGVHLRLNGAVLAQMYEGKIRAWDNPAIRALNPGVTLPGTPVVPLHRSDSSGDTFLFTSYLATHDPAWNSSIGYGTTVAWPDSASGLGRRGNAGMVAGCEAAPGCVAYVGISYLKGALAAGLGEARLANESGRYLLPNASTISAAVAPFVSSTPASGTISMVNGPAAGGYPIVNYEYAIVSRQQPDATRARDIKAFLHWAVTTGNATRYLGQLGFQPLAGDVVSLSDGQIARIG